MDQKLAVLQKYYGYSAFRPGQEAIIDALLSGRDALGIMPTGGGKSLCYQVPALVMEGITLVVSPLISLMQDQVAALKNAGVAAAYINSSLTPEQIRTVYKYCAQGRYKIIYIAPERLLTWDFLRACQYMNISMLAVDEAHCISQWGQDFRPSYLKITDFINQMPYRPVISAFTATATEAVRQDIRQALRLEEPLQLVTGFDRPNLYFDVLRPRNKQQALLKLVTERQNKCGIVYCSTRKDVEKVTEVLCDAGFAATRYHAGLDEQERHDNQEDFLYDRKRIMVATNAFGMGIDKSNVSFVIHYNMPKSLEAYYQEAGRAGRDGSPADCILLYSAADVRIANILIQSQSEQSNLSYEDQQQILEQDRLRLQKMTEYCRSETCFRGRILDYFGQDHEEGCGNCGNCLGEFVRQDITEDAKIILTSIDEIRDRIGYGLGAAMIASVLRGSKMQKILQLHLDRISTYGRLSRLSAQDVRDRIEALENQGILRQNPELEIPELTGLAPEVLEGTLAVSLRVPKAQEAREEKKSVTAQEGGGLFEVLRSLRFRLAQKEHVPVYIIFSNATLQDMAEKQPATMEDFFRVSGVGQYKAQKYGEAFLSAIAEYQKEGTNHGTAE